MALPLREKRCLSDEINEYVDSIHFSYDSEQTLPPSGGSVYSKDKSFQTVDKVGVVFDLICLKTVVFCRHRLFFSKNYSIYKAEHILKERKR